MSGTIGQFIVTHIPAAAGINMRRHLIRQSQPRETRLAARRRDFSGRAPDGGSFRLARGNYQKLPGERAGLMSGDLNDLHIMVFNPRFKWALRAGYQG
jgi:hypothetical protein